MLSIVDQELTITTGITVLQNQGISQIFVGIADCILIPVDQRAKPGKGFYNFYKEDIQAMNTLDMASLVFQDPIEFIILKLNFPADEDITHK
jgi:hypothetical protein